MDALEHSARPLERYWRHLERSWRHLERSWRHLERSWRHLERSWRHLERICRAPKFTLGVQEALWRPKLEAKAPQVGPQGRSGSSNLGPKSAPGLPKSSPRAVKEQKLQVAGIIVFPKENLGFFESGALWGAFGEVLERSWKHWCTRNGRGNRQERGYRQDKGVRRGQLTRRKGVLDAKKLIK